uniref:Uncharacterized protein n=1 Tax=Timema tahoe TaxID=61484 RepID=A0A7R9IJY4_9NEOP|nr:unnamed protein product [Timema tahoe]
MQDALTRYSWTSAARLRDQKNNLSTPGTALSPDLHKTGNLVSCETDAFVFVPTCVGNMPAFAWRESGKQFWRNHPQYTGTPDQDSNLNLCHRQSSESIALDYVASEATASRYYERLSWDKGLREFDIGDVTRYYESLLCDKEGEGERGNFEKLHHERISRLTALSASCRWRYRKAPPTPTLDARRRVPYLPLDSSSHVTAQFAICAERPRFNPQSDLPGPETSTRKLQGMKMISTRARRPFLRRRGTRLSAMTAAPSPGTTHKLSIWSPGTTHTVQYGHLEQHRYCSIWPPGTTQILFNMATWNNTDTVQYGHLEQHM